MRPAANDPRDLDRNTLEPPGFGVEEEPVQEERLADPRRADHEGYAARVLPFGTPTRKYSVTFWFPESNKYKAARRENRAVQLESP